MPSAYAILHGLCEDGGLYMPEVLPSLSLEEIQALCPLSYAERAARILSLFLTDFTYDELLEDTESAYAPDRFPLGATKIKSLSDMDVLELYHGPTCAFKDMALQLMPRLYLRAMKKCALDATALILVATSGDTGKAALEGYRDLPNIKIQVFYPTDGVSEIQKLQMRTQRGDNVSVVAIEGNFDDAQSGVKRIFSSAELRERLSRENVHLSSANSINFGRLVPQIVYYVSAYCDLLNEGKISLGERLNVTVPTGNFGNIFAAYVAKRCGLPLGTLVCASNDNDVLTEFFRTGTYDKNRPFFKTVSPSMDILISSNLERLLYLISGAERTRSYMESLLADGRYTLSRSELAAVREDFFGDCANEDETRATIRETFEKEKYLIDTHTAVAVYAAKRHRSVDKARMLTVSTASPYKFAPDVLLALGQMPKDGADALRCLSERTDTEIPVPLASLSTRAVRFHTVTKKEEMEKEVLVFARDQ